LRPETLGSAGPLEVRNLHANAHVNHLSGQPVTASRNLAGGRRRRRFAFA
jgi:hypothetical protein